jgi:predicted membrane protein
MENPTMLKEERPSNRHNHNVHKLTLCAVMAALLFVLTFLIRIPILASGGYIHIGDTIIYLCGYILGGYLGAAIAGIGSALADLAAGAVIYILPTFVIKALMGFMVGLIAYKQTKSTSTSVRGWPIETSDPTLRKSKPHCKRANCSALNTPTVTETKRID